MLFSTKKVVSSSKDPFLDSIVSMSVSEGTNYTSISALKNSDVFTAVKILAQDMASNPIVLLKNGIVQKPSHITHLLNKKPNKNTTGWHMKFALAVNALLAGNGYAEILFDKTGNVTGFELLKPSEVSIIQEDDHSIVSYLVGNEREVSQENMIHLKFFSYDGIIGRSPLMSLQVEIDLQNKGNKNLLGFFKNGVNSSGILKVNKGDLDAAGKKAIREKFEEANAGDANALRTIVLDETMEYKKMEVSTEVLKLINNNIYSTKQIAKAFGIPLERMGIEMTNTSSNDANMLYMKNTLNHYFAASTAEFDSKLLEIGEWEFGYDTRRLSKMDPEEETKNVVEKLKETIITIDEARRELGYAPLPDGRGERVLANLNFTSLEKIDEYEMRRNKNAQIERGDEN